MAAGIEGAGRERSFGVNIRLPFEQGANPFIALDPKLVEMRYFFTRKLMLDQGVRRLRRPARAASGPWTSSSSCSPCSRRARPMPAPVVLRRDGRRELLARAASGSWRSRSSSGATSRRGHVLCARWSTQSRRPSEIFALLPQLPLDPHGGRDHGAPAPPAPRPAELAVINERFSDSSSPVTSTPRARSAPRSPPATPSSSSASSCASTASTSAGCASSSTRSTTWSSPERPLGPRDRGRARASGAASRPSRRSVEPG